jgi:type I restriction enzyme S subunit
LFKTLSDPRVVNRCDHELSDVLIIALCCLLCGGETFNDMEEFGHAKAAWFKTFLTLRHGIPRHDTFNRRITGNATASEVRSTKNVFRPGTVLYGKLRPYLNKVAQPSFAGVCSTDILVLQPTEAVESNFLAQLLGLPKFIDFAMANSAGINLPRASFKKLVDFGFALPPLAEQRRIVARLEQLEARSRRARAALADVPALLAQARQSLLATAFRGDLIKDWRTKRPTDDRWIASTVGDVVKSVKYGTAVKCRHETQGTPVLRIPNIKDGAVSQQDLKFAELDKRELESLCLEAGDILIIRSNGSLALVGSAALVSEAEAGFAYAGYLIRLRVAREKADPAFLTHTFNSPVIRQQADLAAHSTSGVNNINSEELRNLSFRLPPLAEQREIVRRLERALARLDAAAAAHAAAVAAHAAAVAELESLLARAFRGELVPQNYP